MGNVFCGAGDDKSPKGNHGRSSPMSSPSSTPIFGRKYPPKPSKVVKDSSPVSTPDIGRKASPSKSTKIQQPSSPTRPRQAGPIFAKKLNLETDSNLSLKNAAFRLSLEETLPKTETEKTGSSSISPRTRAMLDEDIRQYAEASKGNLELGAIAPAPISSIPAAEKDSLAPEPVEQALVQITPSPAKLGSPKVRIKIDPQIQAILTQLQEMFIDAKEDALESSQMINLKNRAFTIAKQLLQAAVQVKKIQAAFSKQPFIFDKISLLSKLQERHVLALILFHQHQQQRKVQEYLAKKGYAPSYDTPTALKNFEAITLYPFSSSHKSLEWLYTMVILKQLSKHYDQEFTSALNLVTESLQQHLNVLAEKNHAWAHIYLMAIHLFKLTEEGKNHYSQAFLALTNITVLFEESLKNHFPNEQLSLLNYMLGLLHNVYRYQYNKPIPLFDIRGENTRTLPSTQNELALLLHTRIKTQEPISQEPILIGNINAIFTQSLRCHEQINSQSKQAVEKTQEIDKHISECLSKY